MIRHLREMEADVLNVDVGAGTSYHALDFFLLADRHIAVATLDPTSVLDLYLFVKLAAIRRVLSHFLSRDPMNAALAERDFPVSKKSLPFPATLMRRDRRSPGKPWRRFIPYCC